MALNYRGISHEKAEQFQVVSDNRAKFNQSTKTKLCYRGVPYEKKNNQFKIVESESEAKFRGRYYMIHRTSVQVPVTKPVNVSESKPETVLRFLGRRYAISPIFVEPVRQF
ncbi:MAG: DUF4278 domain-containing protein [Coleofasciculaceae cyanobacterium]